MEIQKLVSGYVGAYYRLMRVLIIGCGYIGVPLGAELARLGHQVFGLRRTRVAEPLLSADGITPLNADITRPSDLATLPPHYDWIVNCVASSGGGADAYRSVYLEGTQNLLEWLRPNPPARFVYTSSTSVYGQTDGSLVDEESPAEPTTETARILVATEKLLLDTHQQERFPAIILRVAGIYGPDRGHYFKQFLRNEARISGQGDRLLNMIHRDDVVGALIAALKNGQPGTIYNAVDDEPVTQLAFFEWLAGRLGAPLPPFDSEEETTGRKRGVTHKKVSNKKLKTELRYEFKYPTFRQGYGAGTGLPERSDFST